MAPSIEAEGLSPFMVVVGSALVKHVFSTLVGKSVQQEPEALKKVGKVSELWIYPVKSCRGIQVESAECTLDGLRQNGVSDRSWIVMNAKGQPMTLGNCTKFAHIKTRVEDGSLCFDAPEMETLRIPIEAKMGRMELTPAGAPQSGYYIPEAVDCGDEAGTWLDVYLNKKGLRLMFSPKDSKKRKTADVQRAWKIMCDPEDQCAFANVCGYMLMGRASLQPLNRKLDVPVTCKSFRPSIIVDGCPAYAEDAWNEVVIGNARLRKIDENSRCHIVNIDPDTGKVYRNGPKNVLKDIHYRPMPKGDNKPNMGIYMSLDSEGGTISVGDTVFARKSCRPYHNVVIAS